MSHIPVLLHESIEGLAIKKGGAYVDCTVNHAGHAVEIAKTIGKKGTLICIDLDQGAIKAAKKNLDAVKNAPTIHLIHSNFRHLKKILAKVGVEKVDGILADLGVSSQELDDSGRGFSFQKDEPLLMTFHEKPSEDMTSAYDIVNFWSESTIADILYGFADETYARRIASRIVEARLQSPIRTTHELVKIIEKSVPAFYRHKKIHFATKTFQALRMAVNDELGSIAELLESLPDVLAPSGRAAVISFHSTEDRLVKQYFKGNQNFQLITKKPIQPSDEEIKNNPRARSAKLRIAEKI